MFQIKAFIIKDFKPHIKINNGKNEWLMELSGDINWKVIDRRCIKCNKRIKRGYMCQSCMLNDEYIQSAKFDGTRGKMLKEIEERPHVVYQAKRKGMWKIGSTQKERFVIRMLETGAEIAGIIAETENGTLARKLEKFIQDEFKMPSTFEITIPRISPSHLIDFRHYYQIPKGKFIKVFGKANGKIIGWFGPEIFLDNGTKINIKEWVGCVIEEW